jgi:hypothetical protein
VYQTALGIPGVTLPFDPIQQQPSYASALSAFQRLKAIRVLFDNGAGGAIPGRPYPGFERSFSRFPIPGTQARSWYLGKAGALTGAKPSTGAADRLTSSRHALPPTDFRGDTGSAPDGLWTATPTYRWEQNPPGTAASYVTAPLPSNTVVIGASAVHLWIKTLDRERGPAGHDFGGAPRWPGDLCPERMAAGQRAQAGPGPEHIARAGADVPRG